MTAYLSNKQREMLRTWLRDRRDQHDLVMMDEARQPPLRAEMYETSTRLDLLRFVRVTARISSRWTVEIALAPDGEPVEMVAIRP